MPSVGRLSGACRGLGCLKSLSEKGTPQHCETGSFETDTFLLLAIHKSKSLTLHLTHRLPSSSFLGLIFRILEGNPPKGTTTEPMGKPSNIGPIVPMLYSSLCTCSREAVGGCHPKYSVPYYNKDPKRDPNIDNYPCHKKGPPFPCLAFGQKHQSKAKTTTGGGHRSPNQKSFTRSSDLQAL